MEKSFICVFLILCLANRSLGGALVPRFHDTSQNNLFEKFWDKMGNLVTGSLHLVGSILPLRGLATIAKDLGIPYAETVLAALTPTKKSFNRFFSPKTTTSVATSQRRSDTADIQDNAGDKYVTLRDEMSSAVGALLGKSDCQKRLACLGGRHLSHVNGASSLALFASSASSFLPEEFREPLSIIKDSIMYSDNCEQYEC